MRTTRRAFWIILAVVAVLGLGGCDRSVDAEDASEAESEQAAEGEDSESTSIQYSAFGVELRESEKFDLISFKDVGLESESSGPNQLIYEAIAQALAYELKVDEEFQFKPRVVHNPELAKPSNHKFCEKERIYVDMWRGHAPKRWGYSMWSGCSEEQQFEWREIEVDSFSPDNLNASVEPLAEGMVESLADASEADCYQQTC